MRARELGNMALPAPSPGPTDMTRSEFVARLDGIGQLERAGVVEMPSVRYELIVIQHVALDSQGNETIESLDTEGTILMKPGEAIPSCLIGEPLELVLDDGRRLPCRIQSADGTLSMGASFVM